MLRFDSPRSSKYSSGSEYSHNWANLRGRDDNFGVYELLIELGILALLVRSGHESMTVALEPFPDS